jgi:hypothetical protein
MLALADELKHIAGRARSPRSAGRISTTSRMPSSATGAEGLAPKERLRLRIPNETPLELVARILDVTAEYPTYRYVRVSQQLRLIGVPLNCPMTAGVEYRPKRSRRTGMHSSPKRLRGR